MKKYIFSIITAIIFHSCVNNRITYIDLEKRLEPTNRNRVVKDSSFLKNGIYLNTDYYDKLISLYSIRHKKEVFIIDEKDKKKLFLSNNYKDVKDIIEPIDIRIVEYFRENYGIELPNIQIHNKSLVYRNRIFVEFVTDLGTGGFVLELIESDMVEVKLAFILVD